MGKDKIALSLLFVMCLSSALSAQTPDWLWATRAGGASSDYGNALATDGAGNSYVAGIFSVNASFGTSTIYCNGSSDLFVAKADADGNWLWAVSAGGSATDYCYDIATDSSGNSYITGSFSGTVSFGTTTLTASGSYSDIYIAKLDASGNWLWAISAVGSRDDYGLGIALDSGGNCFATGGFGGTATFGTTTLSAHDNYGHDIFIAKVGVGGNWLWARRAGGYSDDDGKGIACDSAGNCYVTGVFYDGEADFGGTIINDNEVECVFISKLDASGNWLWTSRSLGLYPNFSYGNDISTDSDGNCYITGFFTGTVNFGASSLSGMGNVDAFIAKLDNSGSWLWAKRAGGAGYDAGESISCDDSGNCYVTGYFNSTADFGMSSLTSSGYSDIFITGLDTNGSWLWALRAGGSSYDSGSGLACNSGNTYLTGSFSATAGWGSASLISSGGADVFISKLGPASPRPKAPTNLELSVSSNNIILIWSPVTEDTDNQPLTPDLYKVYSSNEINGPYSFLGQSASTTYTHTEVLPDNYFKFYKVSAVKN